MVGERRAIRNNREVVTGKEEMSISREDVKVAVRKGKIRKSAGTDGVY